jgi:polyisoprenoid-binding protein YceI
MEQTSTLTRIKWIPDPTHSHIGFKVKHLMVSNVRGEFTDYHAEVFTKSNDFSDAEITISINPSSINTRDVRRDGHLKSPDFFDVENFKEIIFQGITFDRINARKYILDGDLTIKDVTIRTEFEVEFNGVEKDQWGARRAGFEITGKISRKDFGLTWNTALETGGVMVGDEITINCEIELIQQPES